VLPLADVAGLVTDAPPDNDTLRQLRRQGVAILDADAPGSGPPPRDPS
jgi:hypothetical protein